MSAIDCARFEALVAEALAGEAPSAGTLETLRRHAGSCAACAGAAALVDLAALPAAERDPAPAAPPGYWDDFDDRLSARIRGVRRRRAAVGGLVAAAAVAAIAVVVLRDPFRSETVRSHPELDPADAEFEDGFEAFPPAGAIGVFAEGDDGSLVPGLDDLTPEEQRRLLESLREEAAQAAGGEA